MPITRVSRYRKRKRTNYVPRPRRKPYVRKAYRPRIPRAIGVPKHMFAKVRYTEQYQVSIAPSGSDSREYRLNSVFDPDLTGVGGQPYYHDQYQAMFQRYRVYGCMVEFNISCSSANTNLYHPITVLTSYCDDTPAWLTINNAVNAKRSVRKTIIPGQSNIVVKRYYNLRSLAGVSRMEYNTAAVYEARCNANPTRPIIANIMFRNNDGTSTIVTQYYLRMTYYVKYFENVEPAPS